MTKKKVDKMYDFGLLGKWSKETLKSQMKFAASDSQSFVERIERQIFQLHRGFAECMEEIGNKKIKKMTVKELWKNYDCYNSYSEKEKKLHEDNMKYRNAMKEIFLEHRTVSVKYGHMEGE